MAKKTLKFSVNHLAIGEERFNISDFSAIKRSYSEADTITRRGEKEKETLSIKKIEKAIIEDRFIQIYFRGGDKLPYSDTVINVDLEERSNPRSVDEIELKNQFFVVVDSKTQRVYISDQKKNFL